MTDSTAIVRETSTATGAPELRPLCYRGWLIVRQQLGNQLWLRWQHPQEDFPRYGIPVEPNSWHQRLHEVHRSIDCILRLETS